MDYALQMLREQEESASKARAAEIVAALNNLHIDEMSVGTRVSFVKKFSGSKAYTYLALKTHDVIDGVGMDWWYVTNRKGGLTNGEFKELLAEKLGFESFEVLYSSVSLKVPAPPEPETETWKGWVGAPVNPNYPMEPDYVKTDDVAANHPLRGFGRNRQSRVASSPPEYNEVPGTSASTHAAGEPMNGEENPA